MMGLACKQTLSRLGFPTISSRPQLIAGLPMSSVNAPWAFLFSMADSSRLLLRLIGRVVFSSVVRKREHFKEKI